MLESKKNHFKQVKLNKGILTVQSVQNPTQHWTGGTQQFFQSIRLMIFNNLGSKLLLINFDGTWTLIPP
jgi:hypothetical protein